jgi:hypothetical protein
MMKAAPPPTSQTRIDRIRLWFPFYSPRETRISMRIVDPLKFSHQSVFIESQVKDDQLSRCSHATSPSEESVGESDFAAIGESTDDEPMVTLQKKPSPRT